MWACTLPSRWSVEQASGEVKLGECLTALILCLCCHPWVLGCLTEELRMKDRELGDLRLRMVIRPGPEEMGALV